ncbi:MAG: hypothetical protein AAFQ98_12175 [Bacteroidota bacterium]
MDTSLLSLFLPDGVTEYFELVDACHEGESLILYLEEKPLLPDGYEQDKLESKGFYDPIRIQDFPIRGKACYLEVRRRRWKNHTTGKVVSRNWRLLAQGTRMTQDFATFLKGITR